ncbi:hypothetical protein [Pleionea sp. CnH1-48]|uniref:hypothetical protein n=1 Tax=Pleionea sp. CnH1-48 TaxID=2954494 RepID=UPI00209795B7|nr:hypothetical protein [Pleionea sp. CnH1-48]MCO7223083.1 hypothetical protein [Pleionea sp. CnH1-48]
MALEFQLHHSKKSTYFLALGLLVSIVAHGLLIVLWPSIKNARALTVKTVPESSKINVVVQPEIPNRETLEPQKSVEPEPQKKEIDLPKPKSQTELKPKEAIAAKSKVKSETLSTKIKSSVTKTESPKDESKKTLNLTYSDSWPPIEQQTTKDAKELMTFDSSISEKLVQAIKEQERIDLLDQKALAREKDKYFESRALGGMKQVQIKGKCFAMEEEGHINKVDFAPSLMLAKSGCDRKKKIEFKTRTMASEYYDEEKNKKR